MFKCVRSGCYDPLSYCILVTRVCKDPYGLFDRITPLTFRLRCNFHVGSAKIVMYDNDSNNSRTRCERDHQKYK